MREERRELKGRAENPQGGKTRAFEGVGKRRDERRKRWKGENELALKRKNSRKKF